MYYSQYKQDEFLDKNIFKKMNTGFFLEMGADDGVSGSNTLFFEQNRNWKGICVEPRKSAFEKLIRNRRCICENICISDHAGEKIFLEVGGNAEQLSGLVDTYDKKHLDRINTETRETTKIRVDCITLNELLNKHLVDTIDYFSLDTEGGELEILKSIDYSNVTIKCISVENNYKDPLIKQFLRLKGYRKVTEIGIDEIYVLKKSTIDIYREPFSKKMPTLYKNIKKIIKKIMRYNKPKNA